jgi:probable phosphoglycerate mutase
MSDEHPPGIRQQRFTPPEGATTIVLVRHGESMPEHPDFPHPVRDGHGDPELAPNGHDQARRVGERLAAEHHAGRTIDAVYVTSLQRTHQTADPLVGLIGLDYTEVAELREVHLGEWEGEFRARVAAGDPIFAQMLEAERWDVIPGAEPTEAFEQRLRDGIDRIVADHPGGHVVAVVHGGVIGQLIATATGATGLAITTADNASISELVVMPNGVWRIRRYNDASHLD